MEHSSQNRLSGPVSLRPVAFLDIIELGKKADMLLHYIILLTFFLV